MSIRPICTHELNRTDIDSAVYCRGDDLEYGPSTKNGDPKQIVARLRAKPASKRALYCENPAILDYHPIANGGRLDAKAAILHGYIPQGAGTDHLEAIAREMVGMTGVETLLNMERFQALDEALATAQAEWPRSDRHNWPADTAAVTFYVLNKQGDCQDLIALSRARYINRIVRDHLRGATTGLRGKGEVALSIGGLAGGLFDFPTLDLNGHPQADMMPIESTVAPQTYMTAWQAQQRLGYQSQAFTGYVLQHQAVRSMIAAGQKVWPMVCPIARCETNPLPTRGQWRRWLYDLRCLGVKLVWVFTPPEADGSPCPAAVVDQVVEDFKIVNAMPEPVREAPFPLSWEKPVVRGMDEAEFNAL